MKPGLKAATRRIVFVRIGEVRRERELGGNEIEAGLDWSGHGYDGDHVFEMRSRPVNDGMRTVKRPRQKVMQWERGYDRRTA
jgi:hypothetical protein